MAIDERDRLRAQNDSLVDSLQRVTRYRAGMSEVAKTPRPEAQRPVAIPDSIRSLYSGFSSEATKRNLDTQVREMAANGTPFVEIERALRQQMDEPEGVN